MNATRQPVYAKLPQSPINGSPVPWLTSLYHNPDPGPYGDRRYPGNGGGMLLRDILKYFRPTSVSDPLTGSGTCRDVCRELGIPCWSADLHGGFDACDPKGYPNDKWGMIFIHPPYWRQKLYCRDPRDLSRTPTLAAFLNRLKLLIENCVASLAPGGRLVILMGDFTDHAIGFVPLTHYTKELAFAAGLRQCCPDIIRFSHGASSGRKVYRSSFIPGLHDVCTVYTVAGCAAAASRSAA
jgi:hypothetical protein